MREQHSLSIDPISIDTCANNTLTDRSLCLVLWETCVMSLDVVGKMHILNNPGPKLHGYQETGPWAVSKTDRHTSGSDAIKTLTTVPWYVQPASGGMVVNECKARRSGEVR